MRVKPSRHATRDRLHDWFRADIEAPLARRVGGEERLRLILLLAGVLALDSADKATIGAVVADLERSLRIGNRGDGVAARGFRPALAARWTIARGRSIHAHRAAAGPSGSAAVNRSIQREYR